MLYHFRERHTFERREELCKKMMEKHTDRIPVIVEKFSGDKNLPFFSKHRYMVLPNSTIGQLTFIVRESVQLKSFLSIFMFINNILPPHNIKMNELYNLYKDPDGFLYITVSSESAFG
jgi:GABA(A) receptor-associated protein